MVKLMAVLNLTPDSFFESSRVWTGSCDSSAAMVRIGELLRQGADIIDLGAVSTRPGAEPVTLEEEWRRLEPVLRALRDGIGGVEFSIDTTRSEIVRRAHDVLGRFIVNDISAGEDDPGMLPLVAELGLPFVAMHKRGGPQTMDLLCDYPRGVLSELLSYFADFERRASAFGVREWILDPGLGFAKTDAQNWEILENLQQLQVFGRPVLVGAADKRFTRAWSRSAGGVSAGGPGGTAVANALAIIHGASILRCHFR